MSNAEQPCAHCQSPRASHLWYKFQRGRKNGACPKPGRRFFWETQGTYFEPLS